MQNHEAEIASRLTHTFTHNGFTDPSVDDLRDAAGVSLRTLYKYFPSREAMVEAALTCRHQAYLDWLNGVPRYGDRRDILIIFDRLGEWLATISNRGCLFLNAKAAYPENDAVEAIVKYHKASIKQAFDERLQSIAPGADIERLANTLFLLHEGQTQSAMTQDTTEITRTTLTLVETLLNAEDIQ